MLIPTKKLAFMPGYPYLLPYTDGKNETPYHSSRDQEFVIAFSSLLANIKRFFGQKRGMAYTIPGSASLALEISIANLIEENDCVLVIGNKYSSLEAKRLISKYSECVDVLKYVTNGEDKEVIDLEELSSRLQEKPYKMVFAPHIEQETAILLDIESMGRIVRDYDSFFIVDFTASIGAHKIEQEKCRVDIGISGSSWGMASESGLAILSVSERINGEYLKNREIPSEYLALNHWKPVMAAYNSAEGSDKQELPTNLIVKMNEGSEEIIERLESYQQHHEAVSNVVRDVFAAAGFQSTSKQHNLKAYTLSVFEVPEKYEQRDLIKKMSKAGLLIDRGVGDSVETTIRVGHCGFIRPSHLIELARRLEQVMLEIDSDLEKKVILFEAINSIEQHLRNEN